MTRVPLEVWQERCGIVQFCSGRDMSNREAEDIVAAQLGLSDAECRTLRRLENEHQSWQAGGHR